MVVFDGKNTGLQLFLVLVNLHKINQGQSSAAQTWEAMKNMMNMIADALGKGIVKQFPKKF